MAQFKTDYSKEQEYSRPNVTPLTKSDDSFHFSIVSIDVIDPHYNSADTKQNEQLTRDIQGKVSQVEAEPTAEKPSPVITFTEKPSIFAELIWSQHQIGSTPGEPNPNPGEGETYTTLLPEIPYAERV